MNLKINSPITVTDLTPSDKPALLKYLKEKEIYNQTLRIPYPYTDADADWFINHVAEETQQQGESVTWGIRHSSGEIVGGIGLVDIEVGKSHKAEIGYWLAKPFWGQGIMSETVKKVTDYSLTHFKLRRIQANVFDFNQASARVLEKAGYEFEAVLKNFYSKDGKVFHGRMYSKVI